MRDYKGVRYMEASHIPVLPWNIQGTTYDSAEQAKYAAARLFCNVTGVKVKQVKDGFALFWWRIQRG